MKVTCLTAVLLLSLACVAYGAHRNVTVDIYYQTLDTKSKALFWNMLKPTVANLGLIMDVKFVPVGNMSVVGGGWQCPYGMQQCNGNLLEACLVANEKLSQTVKIDIITCMFNSWPNPQSAVLNSYSSTCMNAAGWVKNEIMECGTANHSPIRNRILDDMFKKMNFFKSSRQHKMRVKKYDFPWISINGDYKDDAQVTQIRFKRYVCDSFTAAYGIHSMASQLQNYCR